MSHAPTAARAQATVTHTISRRNENCGGRASAGRVFIAWQNYLYNSHTVIAFAQHKSAQPTTNNRLRSAGQRQAARVR
jgi:hypothetical protein